MSLLDKTLQAYESVIDFAREDLDPMIWTKDRLGAYSLHPGAERRIYDILAVYPDEDLHALAAELRIVGSITTNQYVDDTDIDVHLVPKNPEQWSEDKAREVKVWFDENRDRIQGYISKHPIEVFIQTNPNQDLMSDGVYDLHRKQWVKGPKLMPLDYDPYEDFSSIEADLRDTVEDADKLLGELSRDVIDYDVIQAAMERMSPEQKQHFLIRLESKLQEIEDDIESLYRVRGELVQTRTTSAPTSPEQALHDIELASKWRDANALFKYVVRYNYLRTIGDLKKLLDDGEVSPEDMQAIRKIAGVPDVSQTGEQD
jgi:hypothetical protein